jgi:hypothetical protein
MTKTMVEYRRKGREAAKDRAAIGANQESKEFDSYRLVFMVLSGKHGAKGWEPPDT